MKILKIDIKRGDIDKHLLNITAYTSVKRVSQPTADDIDRISTAEEDCLLLNRYWTGAAGVLAEQVKEFMATFSISDEAIAIELHLSDSFDDSLSHTVTDGMASFITAYMAKAWFSLSLPEKAAEWAEEAARLLAEISRSLYHRRRPVRK